MLIKKDKHLAAAQKFLERGQEERALEEFARVVQEDANDTRTWLKMAEIHARRGALEQARDIYLRTAEIYVGQGFPRKAMTVYKSVLKLTPGHTPGHQVLFLKLAKTGPVVICGDLYHYPEERTLKRIPTFDADEKQTAASREALDVFLKQTGAQLWIQHDFNANAKLKKAPGYYE